MKLYIKESMDSSIPNWLKPYLSKLGKPVSKKYGNGVGPGPFSRKVDIANSVYTELPIPRTSNEFNTLNKDPNRVTVIQLEPEYGDRSVVWIPGYLNDEQRIDWEHNYKARELQKTAVKKILPHVISYGYLTIDPEGLKAKRNARTNAPEDRHRNAQYLQTTHDLSDKGGWDSEGNWTYPQGPAMKTWQTRKGYDKSGYAITGLEKYRKMLADMGVSNYERIIDDAFSVYERLAKALRLCRRDADKRDLVSRQSYNLIQMLQRIESSYDRYAEVMDKSEDSWSYDYYKKDVTEYMKQLRGYVRDAKALCDFVESGEPLDDETYRRFR
jgi:hypothetical protein